jgi:hypothetical protein
MKISWGEGSVRLKAGLSTAVAGILIVLAVTSGLASAAPAMKWTFHAGDAFLGALDPSFSPDVAKSSANGHTLAVMGMGSYSPGGPVIGGGLFWHNRSDGSSVHFGTWSADTVLSYDDFGNAIVNGLPKSLHGGVLVLAVTFTTTDGSGITVSGELTVTCVLGSSVPAGAEEGITAAIPGAISFDESVSGNTVFILTP